MSEFISSEYTSPITVRKKVATSAAKPIIKIAELVSVVSLVCYAEGKSLGEKCFIYLLSPADISMQYSLTLVSHDDIFRCLLPEKITTILNIFDGCVMLTYKYCTKYFYIPYVLNYSCIFIHYVMLHFIVNKYIDNKSCVFHFLGAKQESGGKISFLDTKQLFIECATKEI